MIRKMLVSLGAVYMPAAVVFAYWDSHKSVY